MSLLRWAQQLPNLYLLCDRPMLMGMILGRSLQQTTITCGNAGFALLIVEHHAHTVLCVTRWSAGTSTQAVMPPWQPFWQSCRLQAPNVLPAATGRQHTWPPICMPAAAFPSASPTSLPLRPCQALTMGRSGPGHGPRR